MQVTGRVIKGEGKAGGYYGIPTANLRLPTPLTIDPGVYAGWTTLPSGEVLPSVICYGAGSDQHGLKFEVHLIGFAADLSEQMLSVEIKDLVSNLVAFRDGEQMHKKILDDVAKVKMLLHV